MGWLQPEIYGLLGEALGSWQHILILVSAVVVALLADFILEPSRSRLLNRESSATSVRRMSSTSSRGALSSNRSADPFLPESSVAESSVELQTRSETHLLVSS